MKILVEKDEDNAGSARGMDQEVVLVITKVKKIPCKSEEIEHMRSFTSKIA